MFGWAALVFDGGVHGTVDALGCCWAPMLVMFSVGAADLGWMAALALAALVVLHPSWMPPVMAGHG